MRAEERKTSLDVSHERIGEWAYELHCDGGCEDGHDLEHWLQAEAELAELALTGGDAQGTEDGESK